MSTRERAHDLMNGATPNTAPWPARPEVALQAVDGRTVALRILARYISELIFQLPGDKGSPVTIPYRIKPEDVHIEQPDNVDKLRFPSIVFLPGAGEYQPVGLTPYVVESTRDEERKDCALQVMGEYFEAFTVECWADSMPLRRSLVAALEDAFVPSEAIYGLRFRMPDYHDQTVCFTLATSMRPDDPDAVRNRRWAHLGLEMRFEVVKLVPVEGFRPEVEVGTFEFGLGGPDSDV
jgi:hypothetical protein